MCRSDERTHKHHIIPKYMGGSNDPENLVEVTVTQHAMFHFCNYQLWGNEEDRIAWRALSGQITADEAALEAQSLGAKKGGNKNKENKTGICGLSPEELSEAGKKGGQIGGKKGGNKNKENKTGICGLSFEERSKNGKKAGKIGGNKTKENKTGFFGRSPEKHSEDSKKAGKIGGLKGGKTTTSQKWQCTETGYVSNAAGLTRYQKARGIDASNRIKVDGPRAWEITFEDGKVIVTYQTLKEWAKENGYSYDCLIKVREGKTKNHRGIIKVVAF
jgi:hypothetical protein